MVQRIVLCIIIFLPLAAMAAAFDLISGISLSYGLSLMNDYVPAMIDQNALLNHAAVGVYVDATFARLSVFYVTNLGNPSADPPFTGNLIKTQFGWNLFFKYPIAIKSLTLWSGAGAGFINTLVFDPDGDGNNDRDPFAPLNDLFIVIALGAEFKIGKFITIGPSFTMHYDLTPSQYTSEPDGSYHNQVFLQFLVSVGFILFSP